MAVRLSTIGRVVSRLRSSSGDPLSDLPDDWRVLDEPVSTGGSGRLVVGPGGIFLIRRGGMHVTAGSPRITEATRAAAQVANRITGAVGRPVVVHAVVTTSEDVQPTTQPERVTVVADRLLRRWLLGHPRILESDGVSRVARAARGVTATPA